MLVCTVIAAILITDYKWSHLFLKELTPAVIEWQNGFLESCWELTSKQNTAVLQNKNNYHNEDGCSLSASLSLVNYL